MRSHYNAILRALDKLPAPEKRAARKAMLSLDRKAVPQARAIEAVGEVVRAAARGHAKRVSDQETDRRRRVLVGARVLREDADRYRAAAEARGVSLYAWAAAALERAAQGEEEEKL